MIPYVIELEKLAGMRTLGNLQIELQGHMSVTPEVDPPQGWEKSMLRLSNGDAIKLRDWLNDAFPPPTRRAPQRPK